MSKHEFQAESRRLLELMIHSIYSEKEIFLGELISNASDAMDKLNYLAMSGSDVDVSPDDLQIRIRMDKEKRLLRISDRGIGMNAEELEKNLGVIAKSGSAEFQKKMSEEAKTSEEARTAEKDLIGQFGVGFYSAFMVADRITVLTRKYGDESGWRWDSDGINGFTITAYDKKKIGTDVILRIRDEEKEDSDEYNRYLREYTIYKLVKKYSDYIRYPIKLYMPHPEMAEGSTPENPVFKEEYSYEVLNSMVPLWQRNKSEVTRDQQNDFFKEHFSESTDPMQVISADVEGNVTYKALLFIPAKQPNDYGTEDYKPGLELYSAGVKILDNCTDLLPEEFNFVRGIVDTSDVSLNISREMLQHNKLLTTMQSSLTRKVRNELKKMRDNDWDQYLTFHENFGHHLKVCAMDDYGAKKDSLGEFLLFYSAKEEKMITLEHYVAGMKPDQKYIYYASGDTPEAIANIPQTELVREHDMDILYFMDKADQFVAQMFGNYGGKAFQSVVNGDLDLGGEEEKKAAEKAEKDNEELFSFVKEVLGDRIDEVKASSRLKSHPVCMTNGSGITFEMERYFRSIQPDMQMKAKYILELNTEHEAIKALEAARRTDPEKASKYARILYEQARMIAGLPIEDPSGYTDLIVSLW